MEGRTGEAYESTVIELYIKIVQHAVYIGAFGEKAEAAAESYFADYVECNWTYQHSLNV